VLLDLEDGEPAGPGLGGTGRPTRALDRVGGGADLGVEGSDGAEIAGDRRAEGAVQGPASAGRQVVPEDRVEQVATPVKRDLPLEVFDERPLALITGGCEPVERGVKPSAGGRDRRRPAVGAPAAP